MVDDLQVGKWISYADDPCGSVAYHRLESTSVVFPDGDEYRYFEFGDEGIEYFCPLTFGCQEAATMFAEQMARVKANGRVGLVAAGVN